MANKISCGGFQIDGTSLVEQNGVLKATATGLPDASEATDGQGLIVDNGEFVIGDLPQGGGGSGGVFVVNVSGIYDESTGDTVYTPDKTFEETTAAAESGQVIIVNYDGSFSTILTFTSSGDFGDILRGNYTLFGSSGPDSSYIESYDIEWTSEGFDAQYDSKTL